MKTPIHKDVDEALEDYPYIPRALLELVDFFSAPVQERPCPIEGKRDAIVAFMLLSGAELGNTGSIICPFTRGVIVGRYNVWLKDINQFFKERDQCQT